MILLLLLSMVFGVHFWIIRLLVGCGGVIFEIRILHDGSIQNPNEIGTHRKPNKKIQSSSLSSSSSSSCEERLVFPESEPQSDNQSSARKWKVLGWMYRFCSELRVVRLEVLGLMYRFCSKWFDWLSSLTHSAWVPSTCLSLLLTLWPDDKRTRRVLRRLNCWIFCLLPLRREFGIWNHVAVVVVISSFCITALGSLLKRDRFPFGPGPACHRRGRNWERVSTMTPRTKETGLHHGAFVSL